MTTPTETVSKIVEARCKRCLQVFSYERKFVTYKANGKQVRKAVARTVCDACIEARHKWSLKAWNKKRLGEKKMDVDSIPGEFTARSKIAAELGINVHQVHELELRALMKIRNSPALREAYETFKDEGLPNVIELIQEMKETAKQWREGGTILLEHHLHLMEWWDVHDKAVAAGMKAEAQEVLGEITKMHRMLRRELGE